MLREMVPKQMVLILTQREKLLIRVVRTLMLRDI
jgi:hypothetical protein